MPTSALAVGEARGPGLPGLPSAVVSVRQFDTLGYGCETGPGTHAFPAFTWKSVENGTIAAPVADRVYASMIASAR